MSTRQRLQRHNTGSELDTTEYVSIDALPATMNTTGPKLVYLYMQLVRETTIEDLSETLGMKMLTLYPMLSTLEEEGLVERSGETFAVAS